MSQKDCQKTIDLFLFQQDGKSHYTLIKHFSRLFRSKITSRTNGVTHICFSHFTKKNCLKNISHFVPLMKQLL